MLYFHTNVKVDASGAKLRLGIQGFSDQWTGKATSNDVDNS